MGRRPRTAPSPPDAGAALDVAVRFLATRPRARREVERRLERAGAGAEVIAATLGTLERMGYVDDAAFVRWWAEQRDRHGPRGRRMIEAELRQRGVPQATLEAMRDELAAPERSVDAEALPGTEGDRARIALERHLRGRRLPHEPRALQRLGAFLVRRGFDPETARTTIRAAQRAQAEDPSR